MDHLFKTHKTCILLPYRPLYYSHSILLLLLRRNTCARLEQAKAGVQKYPFGSSFDFFPLLPFISYPAAILDFVDIRYCLVYPFSPSLQFSLFPFLDSSLQDTQAGYPKDLYLKNAWYPPEFLRWSSFGLLSPIILNLYFRVTNAHLAPCHSFRPSSKFTKAS